MTPAALTLRADEGPLKGLALSWTDGSTIGRDDVNAIVLKDVKVSRRHVSIVLEAGRWVLLDLSSRNGTFVNGQKVQRQELKDGDLLQFGSTVLRCVLGAPEPATSQGLAEEPAVTEAITKQSLDFLRVESDAPDAPQQVARSNARLLSLFDFARKAAEAPSLEALWEGASVALASALGSDRAFVLRPVGRSGTWEPFRFPAAGLSAALLKVPVSNSVVAYVREKGDSVLCQTPGADRRFSASESLAEASVASVLCVPVRRGEGERGESVLGALYADRLGQAPPFAHADLELAIAFAIALANPWAQAQRISELSAGHAALERQIESRHDLVGASAAMRAVVSLIEKAAPTDAPVLITGESGAGKELVARAIHRQSARAKAPFEVVNCAVLTENLFESELFGHQRGAFTGAQGDKPGRFELADGGTLFLDEIGDLPEPCQTKLLRVLEDGKIRRLGDTRDRAVDVRIVAATNRDLDGPSSRFRKDLYYRLNVLRIPVPSLRERREDVPLLAAFYAARFSASCRKPAKSIAPEALAVLSAHPWPGNVRELKNCLERMVVLSEKPVLELDDIPSDIRRGGGTATVSVTMADGPLVSLQEVERVHVSRVLAAVDGNKTRAAEILGVDRGTLYAKMKRYGLGDAGGG